MTKRIAKLQDCIKSQPQYLASIVNICKYIEEFKGEFVKTADIATEFPMLDAVTCVESLDILCRLKFIKTLYAYVNKKGKMKFYKTIKKIEKKHFKGKDIPTEEIYPNGKVVVGFKVRKVEFPTTFIVNESRKPSH